MYSWLQLIFVRLFLRFLPFFLFLLFLLLLIVMYITAVEASNRTRIHLLVVPLVREALGT
jgi:hypothetical protein